jgi:hypothetical protein
MTESVRDGAQRIALTTFEAMKATPLAMALLVLNGAFLWFGAYVLGSLAEITAVREKAQIELIDKLVSRECPHTPMRP